MYYNKSKNNGLKEFKAFTLLELVIVIAILAILGTIGFYSIIGYSESSRDSTRISDLSVMKTSLEIFNIDSGKYPLPTDLVDVVYSGTTTWKQGEFGESTFRNLVKLNKIPTDPLVGKKYTYSVTKDRNEFELAGIMERRDFGFNYLDVNAEYKTLTAIVTGNYNGLMQKVEIGEACYILSLPTIIASDLENSTNVLDIVNSNSLVYNGFNNLPGSFAGGNLDIQGGFNFEPNNFVALVEVV